MKRYLNQLPTFSSHIIRAALVYAGTVIFTNFVVRWREGGEAALVRSMALKFGFPMAT